jgi:hypothetical protein
LTIGSLLILLGLGISIRGECGLQLGFREAVESDLKQLVHLLADDVLGADREDASEPLNMKYSDA